MVTCDPPQGEDGKSIRYRDLGALFEQILDKTMKQHQPRSRGDSPVKVWINTFKVFLDEFVTEYKPLNYTAGKVIVSSCATAAYQPISLQQN